MSSKLLKAISLGVFLINLGLVLSIWLTGQAEALWSVNISGVLISIGNLAGLLAFYFVLCQLLLIGRVGWIEKGWGHDRLSHAHHLLGLVAVILIAIHPVLMIFGYSSLAQNTLTSQFWLFLLSFDDVLPAFFGYLMFLSIVAMSLWIVKKRLRYETWYFVHFCLYLAITLVFGHQLELGSDFGRSWTVFYWQLLTFGTLATIVYYRFLKPVWAFWFHDFRVASVERENYNIVSIVIKGRKLQHLNAQSGQFVIVRFFAKNFWWEAHPFSLSEMPNGQRLRITTKALGDFTSKLPDIPLETRVLVEGPLGRFTAERAGSRPVLLIAGGIGITPLRSLFEKFSLQHSSVDLLYATRSDGDFALKKELDILSNGTAKVCYLPEDKFGRLNSELIKKSAPDLLNRFIYLCGPPQMMKAVREALKELGVPKDHVLYERFQLG